MSFFTRRMRKRENNIKMLFKYLGVLYSSIKMKSSKCYVTINEIEVSTLSMDALTYRRKWHIDVNTINVNDISILRLSM